ncbi:MAG: hypothetical protein QME94_13555, partial [Anaerolineae bacterium]|nr:hypothetical protein [Anaerolineae bacterium]
MASVGRLVAGNTPWGFWRLLGEFTVEDWESAVREALGCLAGLPAATCPGGWAEVAASVLGEGQFGPGHWQLGASRRCYYAMRRLLPPPARGWLQRLAGARAGRGSLLRWPVEDRYVRFQFEAVRRLCERHGLRSVPYIHFWPQGRRFAFVLTHDVETAQGLAHLRRVAGLEEQYGLRSSFNFVPEAYEVDQGLLGELRQRGFEIGVHGLRHDGRLYSSRETFRKRARSINGYLRAWRAVGFRSPMTHRNPEWMQALEIEYDSSFFDTDPFEPVAGGTMSIWPFLMGRFVELPYTLAQ